MNKRKSGILKATEITVSLGLLAGGIAGLFPIYKLEDEANKKYQEYVNSDVVMERIDEDLTNLDKLYQDGLLDEENWTKLVEKKKDDTADEIFAEDKGYLKAKYDRNSGNHIAQYLLCTFPAAAVVAFTLFEGVSLFVSKKTFIEYHLDKSNSPDPRYMLKKIPDNLPEVDFK